MNILNKIGNKFIIHIADSSKFLNDALSIFEQALPNRNIVFLRERNPNFEVTAVDSSQVIYQNEDSLKYEKKLTDYILNSIGVVVHNLNNDYKRNLILNLPQKIPVIWFSWGPDLWVVPNMYRKLFAPLTYRLVLKKHYYLKYVLYSIRDLIYRHESLNNLLFFLGYRKNILMALKAIERTNFLATVIPIEYDLLKKVFDYKGEYLRWNYPLSSPLLESTVKGNRVLVGHSSHSINNHLDCFDALMRKNVKQDIVVPCSYGDDLYRDRLILIGKKLFGSHFYPITDFMSFHDYAIMLQSCSAAIMGQYCQQGLGTAIILLWQGTKLFLSERNPMFIFFKSNQINCFSIEHDLGTELINKPLCKDKINENRDILQRLYGQKQLLANTQSLCNIFENYKHV